jgi:hypothetical protein
VIASAGSGIALGLLVHAQLFKRAHLTNPLTELYRQSRCISTPPAAEANPSGGGCSYVLSLRWLAWRISMGRKPKIKIGIRKYISRKYLTGYRYDYNSCAVAPEIGIHTSILLQAILNVFYGKEYDA